MLCHTAKVLKNKKAIRENGKANSSITLGYRPNTHVFSQEQKAILVEYQIKCSNIYYGLAPNKDKKVCL